MILTPLPAHRLNASLAAFASALEDKCAARALRRIVRMTKPRRAAGCKAALHRRAALALARRLGMGILRHRCGRFGWNGRALLPATEAYVLLHEIAHFQLAPPGRRRAIDFGLGPGPDTSDRVKAERLARVFGAHRDREEALASLLGILWEAHLRQPALASLLDQNWLEGADRAAAARHFSTTFRRLVSGGYTGANGVPRRRLSRGTP